MNTTIFLKKEKKSNCLKKKTEKCNGIDQNRVTNPSRVAKTEEVVSKMIKTVKP